MEPSARGGVLADVTGLDIGLLVMRVGIGVIFLGHGLQKLGWFKGGGYPHDISSQKEFLTFLGYSSTTLLAWGVTLTEIVSGLSLLLGAVSPLGAAGAAGIMFQPIAGYQWDLGSSATTKASAGSFP